MAGIVRVEAFRVELPVVKQFVFASGTAGPVGVTAAHIYVKLTDSDGRVGWGEGRPSPGSSYETPESVMSTIHRYLGPRVLGLVTTDRRGMHHRMREVIGQGPSTGQPVAKCAVDMALHAGCSGPAGLNGSQFIADVEIFPNKGEIEYTGVVHLGTAPGIGIEPDEPALRSLAGESVRVEAP